MRGTGCTVEELDSPVPAGLMGEGVSVVEDEFMELLEVVLLVEFDNDSGEGGGQSVPLNSQPFPESPSQLRNPSEPF